MDSGIYAFRVWNSGNYASGNYVSGLNANTLFEQVILSRKEGFHICDSGPMALDGSNQSLCFTNSSGVFEVDRTSENLSFNSTLLEGLEDCRNGSREKSNFPLKSVIIPLYTLIFFLAVVGNALVMITFVKNRRMRTVTNVLLLNLVSNSTLDLGHCCLLCTIYLYTYDS